MTIQQKQRYADLKKYDDQVDKEIEVLVTKTEYLFNTSQEIHDQLEELEASV